MILTNAYTTIVALRVRLEAAGELTQEQRQEIAEQVELLQRLANTYETLACLVSDEATRRPCAFVAATAHQLLHRALHGTRTPAAVPHLAPDGISSQVAALLLFFIAGAFPDAAEAASQIEVPSGDVTESLLVRAVVSLARGRLDEISNLPATPSDKSATGTLEDRAIAALWKRLYDGLRALSADLLASPVLRTGAASVFEEVERVAVAPVDLTELIELSGEMDAGPAYEVFGGPHHLATLLKASGGVLLERAVTQVPPPSDQIDPNQWSQFLERIAHTRPCLWPNHLDALKKGFLVPGMSAAISFPTGSGKSTLVQLKIEAALLRDKRTIFLVPTHALVDQVRRDLQTVFPKAQVNVTPLMEELGEDDEAKIDVMTPERCLARLGVFPDSFGSVGLVIFDECHLLHPRDDDDRRSVDAMLCLLNLLTLAADADVVMLSAMMANAPELSEWLATFGGRQCIALDMDWKPTRQARGCLVYRAQDVTMLNQVLAHERTEAFRKAADAAKDVNEAKKKKRKWKGKPGAAVSRKLTMTPYGLFSLRHTWITHATADYALHQLLNSTVSLGASDGLSSWYLTANRNKVSADLAVGYALSGVRTMVLAQAARDLPSLAATASKGLVGKRPPATLTSSEQVLAAISTEELGDSTLAYLPVDGLVAIHHGMMLPSERRLSEQLFARAGGVSILAVSPTLAQGVNLPADAIIIAGDDRWDIKTDARAALAAHEVLNAAGRAGRAGSSALGIVLVVPGVVISFDEAAHSLQKRWFDLQERVFSKSDQCLAIRDPIERWLDHLQLASAQQALDPNAEYFLTRLPVDADGTGERPREFLSRTLAAYHARKGGNEARYAALVEHVIGLRAHYAGHTGSWHDSVSAATGVPVQVIRELDAALALEDDAAIESRDVSQWVAWWFAWLRAHERCARLLLGDDLFQRLFPRAFKEDPAPVDLWRRLLDTLENVVVAWMAGASLKALELLLGSSSKDLGHCDGAREFSIRHTISIAYAVGLIARVREAQIKERKQAELEDFESFDLATLFLAMPLSLSSLHGCVRAGLSRPEELALYNLNGVDGARVRTHRQYARIAALVEEGGKTEGLKDTQQRVKAALRLASQAD